MDKLQKALQDAFPHTLPVFAGFTFLGMAYGILMSSNGYGIVWTLLFSILVFAGSGQYLAITFLTSAFHPLNAFLMTLMINARHLFYGVSMLERYRNTGLFKPYLIFGLCDETFSIVCSTRSQDGVEDPHFLFSVTILDHLYWIFGSFMGALLGSTFSFNAQGLDFVLTALFVVIFVDQWKKQEDHKPAIIGVLCSIGTLLIFGPNGFMIPAMISIMAAFNIQKIMDKKKIQLKEETK